MARIGITVTQDDVDNARMAVYTGVGHRSTTCPIAQGARRRFNTSMAVVGIDGITSPVRARATKRTVEAIYGFDRLDENGEPKLEFKPGVYWFNG